MKLFTNSIQKYIAVAVMGIAICFGVFALTAPSMAKAQSTELSSVEQVAMQVQIQQLMVIIAQLQKQLELQQISEKENEKVIFDLLDTDITTYVSDDFDEGAFTLEFELTALDTDIYIPEDIGTNLSNDNTGIVFHFYNSNGLISSEKMNWSADVYTTADESGEQYVVEEGETETFELTVTARPLSAEFYSVAMAGIHYYDDGAKQDTLMTLGLGNAHHTDPVYLKGDVQALDKSIKVTTPNGGEKWTIGETNTITWTPYAYDPDVNGARDVDVYLEKKQSNGTFKTIGKIMDQGKASLHTYFEIDEYGNFAKPGTYYVRAVNRVTGEEDRSDKSFKLVEKEGLGIKVTAPNGGEKWTIGETNTITWTPYGYNPDVNGAKDVSVYLQKKRADGTFKTIGKIMDQGKASLHTYFEIDEYGNFAKPGTYYVLAVNDDTGRRDRSDKPFTLVGDADDSDDSQLHVVGVYEAKDSKASFCESKWGTVVVNISPSLGDTPIVLGLSAYEPVRWRIKNPSGVEIEKIVLSGYNTQRVTGEKGGAKVVHRTFYKKNKYEKGGDDGQGAFYDGSAQWPGTIYNWASECADSEAVAPDDRRYFIGQSNFATGHDSDDNSELLKKMKTWTGVSKVSSFNGALKGSSFTVGAEVLGVSTTNNGEAYIEVTSPNGSETFSATQDMTIKWDSQGVDRLSLALYKDNKWLQWIEKDMEASEVDKGVYVWSIPEDVVEKVDTDQSVLKIYATARKADITGYADDKSDTTFAFETPRQFASAQSSVSSEDDLQAMIDDLMAQIALLQGQVGTDKHLAFDAGKTFHIKPGQSNSAMFIETYKRDEDMYLNVADFFVDVSGYVENPWSVIETAQVYANDVKIGSLDLSTQEKWGTGPDGIHVTFEAFEGNIRLSANEALDISIKLVLSPDAPEGSFRVGVPKNGIVTWTEDDGHRKYGSFDRTNLITVGDKVVAPEPSSSGKYYVKSVNKVMYKKVDPIVGAVDDEYTQYTIHLKNGSKRTVKRYGFAPEASFEKELRATGYSGTMRNFEVLLKNQLVSGPTGIVTFAGVNKKGILKAVGVAEKTKIVGFSISDKGGKAYGSGDIAVKEGRWSHKIKEDLAAGKYTLALYVDNKKIDARQFTLKSDYTYEGTKSVEDPIVDEVILELNVNKDTYQSGETVTFTYDVDNAPKGATIGIDLRNQADGAPYPLVSHRAYKLDDASRTFDLSQQQKSFPAKGTITWRAGIYEGFLPVEGPLVMWVYDDEGNIIAKDTAKLYISKGKSISDAGEVLGASTSVDVFTQLENALSALEWTLTQVKTG